MPLTAEREMARIGASQGAEDHDHDLIQALSRRLDDIWRYDQYIANAESKPEVRAFWEDMKRQDQQNVMRLKQLIGEEVRQGCF